MLDDYQSVALASADWSPVTKRAQVDVFHDHVGDVDELAERLVDADVVVLMRERTPCRSDLLERLPKLKLVVTTGPFNASIDVSAARERGIIVCGTGGHIHPTVELTWALILTAARHLPAEVAAVRTGEWQKTVGFGLRGRRLGVIGLGRIGSLVARLGRAFDMEVVAWSQNLTDERAGEAGARMVTKDELLATSDIVTIHLVLSDRTLGLIGKSELQQMKAQALLVNTSRGPIVDEAALVDALRSGVIAGAALDVFDQEPLPPGHPLRTLPNVVATPHIGYVARETYELFYGEVVEDIAAFLDGSPVRVIS